VEGTTLRPRLSVFRSNKAIYAQLIDDSKGHTVAAASSSELDKKSKLSVAVSKSVGKKVAEKALASGVKEVVFDRNGYLYHGNVKALADGAREAGLKF
jgi:large subunit ribosomal protein L18